MQLMPSSRGELVWSAPALAAARWFQRYDERGGRGSLHIRDGSRVGASTGSWRRRRSQLAESADAAPFAATAPAIGRGLARRSFREGVARAHRTDRTDVLDRPFLTLQR